MEVSGDGAPNIGARAQFRTGRGPSSIGYAIDFPHFGHSCKKVRWNVNRFHAICYS
jgi:hypothetical protein